ncbi:acyltransferase family protein [Clostridium sp. CF012]|uniref:acyltransferase family protein n=1 Tax=Clostridium sp. CF012 TaxID=2843319 RepID=UPI001C0A97DA|nr:acyltransferase family protein [Clostridium sp. CF012]MBU3143468.1 acyltransferase family protein [Clostridium sp. CF012]
MEEIKRDVYWDIIKGLGIIAVVLGHSGFKYGIILNYYHLAIFFFVAGFFYKDKYSYDLVDYIIKKVKDLWWPLIKYGIVFIILHNIFIRMNIYSTITGEPMIYPKVVYSLYETVNNILLLILTGNQLEEVMGASWFVFPLFCAMIIFCFIRNIAIKLSDTQTKREIYIYILCWLIGGVGMILSAKKLQLVWRIDVSLIAIPIISCGYVCKTYWSKIKLNWIMAIMGVFVIVYFYRNGLVISFAAGQIGNPIAFTLVTFAGIYINLYIGKILLKTNKLKCIFACLGRESFHIMVLQFLAMKLINLIAVLFYHKELYNIAKFPYSNINLWILNTLAGLFIPVLGVWLFNKIVNKLKNVYYNKKYIGA